MYLIFSVFKIDDLILLSISNIYMALKSVLDVFTYSNPIGIFNTQVTVRTDTLTTLQPFNIKQ